MRAPPASEVDGDAVLFPIAIAGGRQAIEVGRDGRRFWLRRGGVAPMRGLGEGRGTPGGAGVGSGHARQNGLAGA